MLVGAEQFTFEEDAEARWMLVNLAEMMRGEARSVGCIVVYPGDGSTVAAGGEGRQPPPFVRREE